MGEGRGRWIAIALALAATMAGCAGPAAEAPPPAAPDPALGCETPCGVTIETGRLWEPMIAVNPADPLHLVASSQVKYPDPVTGSGSWALSHVSRDGGLTWETHRLPGGRDAPPEHPLATVAWMDDSVPLFLPDGTLLWTVLAFEYANRPPVAVVGGNHLVALRSHDGGATFPEVSFIARGSGGELHVRDPVQGGLHSAHARVHHDKQWATLADDGTILVVWSQNFGGRPDACGGKIACTRLLFSTSADGLSWSEPRVIVEDIVSGAYPVALADDTWIVAYHHFLDQQVRVARSRDRGATWEDQNLGPSTKFPVAARAATPTGERVYLVYPEGQDERDGEQAVVVRASDDGGATWSAPRVLDAPAAPGRTIPAIAPAPGGGAYVTSWSPEGDGARYLAFHVALDGTVSGPLALDAHQGATAITGDYMGLAPLPEGGAFAVWTTSHEDALRLAGARLRFG